MNKNLIIIVDRQFASGGLEICEFLSKHFNLPLYNKKYVRDQIEKKGFDPVLFDNAQELANNSLIYSLSIGIYAKEKNLGLNPSSLSMGHSINQVQSDIITELANKGPCIFIGCCADYILRDFPGCVKIFIKADMNFRIKRARKREGFSENDGENAIKRRDIQRESYHSCFADGSFGSNDNYHLVIDSSFIGIEKSEQIIVDFINNFLESHKDIKK